MRSFGITTSMKRSFCALLTIIFVQLFSACAETRTIPHQLRVDSKQTLRQMEASAALISMIINSMSNSRVQTVYVSVAGLDVGDVLSRVKVSRSRATMLKAGLGYQVRNSRLIDRATEQPCAILDLKFSDITIDAIAIVVSWTSSWRSDSVERYQMIWNNGTWEIKEHTIISVS